MLCEGKMNRYSHDESTVKQYILYDTEGNEDLRAFLCKGCVEADISRKFDWRVVSDANL